ncbi:MAG: ACP S-malonyltransferase [Burkholderiales bacterium]
MKFAFVFPGQGSQSIGMMTGFSESAAVKQTFEQASDVLQLDMWKMAQEGPVELQNQTVNTQPLMLTASTAIFRAWKSLGGADPAFVAGHSLGEYSALVAAGVLSLADALPLVVARAEAMQHAVPDGEGAMAALVGLDDEAVRAVCSEAAQGQVLEAVNLNCPGQVVIAGNKAAVERGIGIGKAKGAKIARILAVSVPSHCALMKPAAEKLALMLQQIKMIPPTIPVLHNSDVQSYTDPDAIRRALVQQLYSPVRWSDIIRAMVQQQVTHIAECGPGKVLAGLNKRIDSSLQSFALTDAAALAAAKTELT